MHLRPGGRVGPRIAPRQLLVNGERRFAVRRIQLRLSPQPQVRIARPQQGHGRVRAGRILIRHLAELVGCLDAVPRLEVTLGEMVVYVGHLGLAGAELIRQSTERHERLAEVPAPELSARLRQLGDRIRGRHDAGAVVACRQERGTGDEQRATHGPHGWFGGGTGDGASALPKALIFSCARSATAGSRCRRITPSNAGAAVAQSRARTAAIPYTNKSESAIRASAAAATAPGRSAIAPAVSPRSAASSAASRV